MAADTPTRILDAAERLLAERGYRGTSIRAVAGLAGVNLAAPGYHFGSKERLAAAVVRRAVEPIITLQRSGLDRLLAGAADPTPAALVEAFFGPMLDGLPTGEGDEGGSFRARVVMAVITDPADEMRSWGGPSEAAVREAYLAALARALPDVDPDELGFRLRSALAVAAVDRVAVADDHGPAHPPATARRRVLAFIAAGMSAPTSADRDGST